MSQSERLYDLLKDGLPHRTDEIMDVVYGGSHLGLARVGARIYDVKQKYGVSIKGWHDEDQPALYWYQLTQTERFDSTIKPEESEREITWASGNQLDLAI